MESVGSAASRQAADRLRRSQLRADALISQRAALAAVPAELSLDGTWEVICTFVSEGCLRGVHARYNFFHAAGSEVFAGENRETEPANPISNATIDRRTGMIEWTVKGADDGIVCQAQLDVSQPLSLHSGKYWQLSSRVELGTFRGRKIGVNPEKAIEERSTAEKAASAYIEPSSVIESVRNGDVLLVKATWVLQRAGYEEANEVNELGDTVVRWVPRNDAQPLLNRQQIEAMPNSERRLAIMTADEIEIGYRAFQRIVAEATTHWSDFKETIDALPVIAVSQCWEEPSHPDLNCRTLRKVAEALAGEWQHGQPISGLELFRDWGYKDVGVFFDWSSLYQNKPVKRSDEQEKIFKRALSNMSLWYAHMLNTVYVVWGQDEHLWKYDMVDGQLVQNDKPNPRSGRGWPFYEEAMCLLLKKPSPEVRQTLGYTLPARHPQTDPSRRSPEGLTSAYSMSITGGGAPLWRRSDFMDVFGRGNTGYPMWFNLEGEPSEARAQKAWDEAGCNMVTRYLWPRVQRIGESRPKLERSGYLIDTPPPIAPTSFKRILQEQKEFTNKSDDNVVAELYRSTMQDGLGGLRILDFSRGGERGGHTWGDEEMRMLCETLKEVHCPLVEQLNLRFHFSSLVPFGEAISSGAVPNLRILKVCSYTLTAIPDEICLLGFLEQLSLGGCSGLEALPKTITEFTSLRSLNLDGVTRCVSMPDLSLETMPPLNVECVSWSLQPWEKGGYKTWDLMKDGWPRDSTRIEITTPAITTLPGWLSECTSQSLHLYLEGCDGLTSMPDLSAIFKKGASSPFPPFPSGVTLSDRRDEQPTFCRRLQPWADRGYKAWDLMKDGWSRDSKEINFNRFAGATLPDWLGECHSLRLLHLKHCSAIRELPDSVCRLSTLELLDLAGCTSLTALPQAMGRMVSLTHLYLSHCRSLKSLPDISELRQGGLRKRPPRAPDLMDEMAAAFSGLPAGFGSEESGGIGCDDDTFARLKPWFDSGCKAWTIELRSA